MAARTQIGLFCSQDWRAEVLCRGIAVRRLDDAVKARFSAEESPFAVAGTFPVSRYDPACRAIQPGFGLPFVRSGACAPNWRRTVVVRARGR
jgi:hypothetical protein